YFSRPFLHSNLLTFCTRSSSDLRSSARQGRRRTSVRPSLSATLRRPTPTTLRWPVRSRSQTPAPLRPANDRRRRAPSRAPAPARSEEHTSELKSREKLVFRRALE